jgi:rhomboid protease GluP
MPAKAVFGKRAAPQGALPRAVVGRPSPASPPPVARSDTFGAFYVGGIPVVTCGLIVILALIFATEIRLTPDAAHSLSPSRQALIALGGIDGKLVIGAGEWWRIFTAPMLHASLTHILGNSIALFLAGLFLEPVIGAGWFGALFFVAALGGAAGSLAQNDPALVSVGASGAISGLLAAGLFFSAREKDPARRRRMQILTGRILIPAVAPIFFHEGATGGTDYGAHAGGAMAGLLLCFALSAVWPRDAKRPAFQDGAMAALGRALP